MATNSMNHRWLAWAQLGVAMGCAPTASSPAAVERAEAPARPTATSVAAPAPQPAMPSTAPVAGSVSEVSPTPARAAPVLASASAGSGSTPAAAAGSMAAAPAAEGGKVQASAPALREVLGLDWELQPGAEKYLCLRAPVTETAYYQRLHPALARGTHHMGLMVSQTADAPNGESECDITVAGERMVASGGPGTQDLELPDGVAMRIDAGEQLLLQLHLYNVSDMVLRGHSGVDAATIAAQAVRAEAEHVPAQLLALNVPHGRSVASARCTFDRAQTLIGLLPHMHGTGRHVKVTLHTGAGERLLHDADFDFMEQRRYAVEPVAVAPGDYLDYECTYENSSDRTRSWGESTSDEMCMVGTLRYPGSKATTPITCLF